MYSLKKTISISAAHHLSEPYAGPCSSPHGHNWRIMIYCRSGTINDAGMIVDFSEIKKIINQLDHTYINNIIPQPTAENIARWVVEKVPCCYKADVEETEGSVATYEL
jgi:6-pyruvoyltetrahydropterin/6-carboxytetrahydropterin synthase